MQQEDDVDVRCDHMCFGTLAFETCPTLEGAAAREDDLDSLGIP